MKKISLIACLIFGTIVFAAAQDVKIKKGVVSVNGNDEALIEDDSPKKFTLKTIEDGEDLAFFILMDPSPNDTPQFNDNYYIIRFPDHDKDVEFKDYRKLLAIKFLFTHKVIEGGKINIENLNAFVERFGVK